MNQYELGKFISDIRNKRGMTQDELAEKIGMESGKTISKWECGNNMPSFEILIKISKALNITLYEMSICKEIEDPTLLEYTKTKFKSIKDLKRLQLSKKIIIVIAVILGIIFGICGVYTINNYDNVKIFNITNNDNNFTIEGNLVLTNKFNLFNLTKIKNVEENNNYLNKMISDIQYEIYEKNQLIMLFNDYENDAVGSKKNLLQSINSISFSLNLNKNNLPKSKDLKLKISYLDDNKKLESIIIPFQICEIYRNSF